MDLNHLNELFLAQKMLAFGNKYIVVDVNNNVLLYSKQKMFKLKEDFRFYLDEDQNHEFIRIAAQSIIDFSSKYHVIDSATGDILAIIKKEGLKSLLKGKWLILDSSENLIAEVNEESTILALLRRTVDFAQTFLPVKFVITKDGNVLGSISKKFALIRDRYYIDLHNDPAILLDRRVVVALSVLLDSINQQ